MYPPAGLLHRAVALSGSPLNSWALQYRPKELFQKFASNANCTRGTTKSTVECLRSKGVDEINEAQVKLAVS
jgi:carboxylesterase type B